MADSTTQSKKEGRQMWLGLSLDSWNNLIVAFGVVSGIFVVLTGGATYVTFRLQKHETRLARERAAVLEKEVAEANLKTELLKEQLGWREVTAAQVDKLKAALSRTKMAVVFHWGAGDAEASHFAHALAAVFHAGGVNVVGGSPIGQLGEERHGISVSGWRRNEVQLVAKALHDAGYGQIQENIVPPPAGPNTPGQYTDIFIGYRRAPEL